MTLCFLESNKQNSSEALSWRWLLHALQLQPMGTAKIGPSTALRAVLLAAAVLCQLGGVMSDWATLHALLSSVMYYASPLLMLAGIAGFATCMAMWVIRK